MSKLLSELWASTPLSSTFRSKGVELPPDSESSALMDKGQSASEKCDLRIEGMTCGSCVEVRRLCSSLELVVLIAFCQAIEGMLREQPGIHSIKVALLAERGVVEYDPKTWDAEKIISVCTLCTDPVVSRCSLR